MKLYTARSNIGGIARALGSVQERFYAKTFPDPICGCWLWGGDDNGRNYGCLGIVESGKQRRVYAHRLSYEMHVGPIPEGMEIDHKCKLTLCVNPNHLRLVTPAENLAGRTFKGRPRIACPKGHPYTDENSRLVNRPGRPYRVCKVCEGAWQVGYRARKAARRA